jgi:hypothetical protein
MDMRSALASAPALFLMACSQAGGEDLTPRIQDVDRLEAKLASQPCVGDLQKWERNYRYGMSRRMFWPQSDYVDLDVIEFHFRSAGTIAIRPERNLVGASENRDWRDSSPIQTIDGSFVISSGRLKMTNCRQARRT